MRIPWLDLTDVRQFVTEMVADLDVARSKSIARGDKGNRIDTRVERILGRAAAFESEHSLNIYRKAKMVSLLRAGLQERRWPTAHVDDIVNRVLLQRLTRRLHT